MSTEPHITINGEALNVAQAMAVRVAIESFASSLQEENSLGDDEHGRTMVKGYRQRIDEIRTYMYKEPEGDIPKRAQVPM